MIAPLISPVCKYRQATSTDTKLPEQAVSIVILYGINLSLDADWGAASLPSLPWSLDIEKMADSITQNCSTHTNGDGRGSIFRVTCLNVGVICGISGSERSLNPLCSESTDQRRTSLQSSRLELRLSRLVGDQHFQGIRKPLRAADVVEGPLQ